MVSIIEKFDIPKEVVVKIENSTINLSKKDIKASIKISKPFKVYLTDLNALVLVSFAYPSRIKKRSNGQFLARAGALKAKIKKALSGLVFGFTKELELVGVGFKAELQDPNELLLKLGFSHNILIDIPDNLNLVCPKENLLIIKSSCKESLGSFVAILKKYKAADVYKNKGILIKGDPLELKKFKKK